MILKLYLEILTGIKIHSMILKQSLTQVQEHMKTRELLVRMEIQLQWAQRDQIHHLNYVKTHQDLALMSRESFMLLWNLMEFARLELLKDLKLILMTDIIQLLINMRCAIPLQSFLKVILDQFLARVNVQAFIKHVKFQAQVLIRFHRKQLREGSTASQEEN